MNASDDNNNSAVLVSKSQTTILKHRLLECMCETSNLHKYQYFDDETSNESSIDSLALNAFQSFDRTNNMHVIIDNVASTRTYIKTATYASYSTTIPEASMETACRKKRTASEIRTDADDVNSNCSSNENTDSANSNINFPLYSHNNATAINKTRNLNRNVTSTNQSLKLKTSNTNLTHHEKNTSWNKEQLHEEALKYNTRNVFQECSVNAYNAATKRGLLDDICQHMEIKLKTVTCRGITI